jgi:hypothetical protein
MIKKDFFLALILVTFSLTVICFGVLRVGSYGIQYDPWPDYDNHGARAISAGAEIHPEALNLGSRGKWITAYVKLPEGYDVHDIDVSSILLNGTVPAEPRPISYGDSHIMVKFDRTAVAQLILSKGIKYGNVTLTITGKLNDGIAFEGSDIIRVKMPGDINCDGKVDVRDVAAASVAYGSHPGHPRWNPMADENEDDRIDVKDLSSIIINYGRKYK